ncbi:MAG: hypothetical protein M3N52_08635 [Actinomycetota bacterium]|nr:hypothetical protein [Actinomycetota bacterium]
MGVDDSADPASQPDFGPGGYLPPRASKRARKIVLREQMGIGWPLAAVVAALVVAGAGLAFLLTRAGPPEPPFLPVATVGDLEAGAAQVVEFAPTGGLLVVRAGGRLRAFAAPPEPVAYCPESRRLESPSGDVWTLEGRLTGGDGPSLRPVVSQLFDGVLYVDPTTEFDPAPPEPSGEAATCTR